MHREEIEKIIKEEIASSLDIDISQINLNKRLVNDLGMDSFGAVELAFALKQHFGTDITPQELKGIKTVLDILDYVSKKRGLHGA